MPHGPWAGVDVIIKPGTMKRAWRSTVTKAKPLVSTWTNRPALWPSTWWKESQNRSSSFTATKPASRTNSCLGSGWERNPYAGSARKSSTKEKEEIDPDDDKA